jgi:hypothetical protein
MLKTDWRSFEISPDQTYHLADGGPAYAARFLSVLKFHEPGLAPVQDVSGAYHIDPEGKEAYSDRFMRTFGFYDMKAAVQSSDSWHHILPSGSELYPERFAWCGNFQQNLCVVKDFAGRFFHLNQEGKKAYAASYQYAGDFRDGYAVVQDDQGFNTHIDFHGNPLHGKKFLDLDVFHKGFARARDKKGWFHIDSQGTPQYPHRYKNIEPFYNGIARVETATEELLLINESGEKITSLRAPTVDVFHQVSAELVSYWRFYTIDAACKFKLFDFLPDTAASLSAKLSLPPSATEMLLKALHELEFVQKRSGKWLLSDKGAFLTSRHPFSLLSAQKLWKDEHLDAWKNLLYSLKNEAPAFNYVFGKSWFDYLQDKEEKNELYHKALSIYAKRDYATASSRIDLSPYRSIVDIGGSSGFLMMELLQANPQLQGMILDLPNVISLIQIPPHLKKRLQLIPADFFDTWPPFTSDTAILSRLLHDWSDENCVEILMRTHAILSNNGRIFIIENILDNFNGALLNLHMLVMTEGKERSLDSFEKILKKSGFVLDGISPLNEVSTILIAKRVG